MMKSKLKVFILVAMAIALMTGIVYANPDLSASISNPQVYKPGDRNVVIEITVTSHGAPFNFTKVEAKGDLQGVNIIGITPQNGTIGPGKADLSMEVSISGSATAGAKRFDLFFNGDEISGVGPMYILVGDENTILPPIIEEPSGPRTYRPAADFSFSIGSGSGFSPGGTNSVTFHAINRGDTPIRGAEFTIELPAGMSVYNTGVTSFIGTVSIGQRVGRTFSVMVDDDIAGGKAYPVTIKLTGFDRDNGSVSLQNTFYIPVTGSGGGAVRDILIENISAPAEVSLDEDFTLEFSVRNSGGAALKNIKAYADIPEGLMNKSNATFVIDSLGAGETQVFSIVMSARNASNRSYPIKIAVEPLSGTSGEVIKYASVYAKGGSGDARTPQLIVDRYSYGGGSVLAGKEFILDLGLFNTSSKTLSNIKVTIISDDGTFVPVDSSNSFFVERIGAGGHHSKSLVLAAKPSAEQKTTGITVRMSYEDGEGGSFNADDTISIPVMQVMRLSVDEIIPPYESYVGMMGYSSLQFYNLGKTTLNNLMINAEGNFDVMESNNYYVGNMEGGQSDRYSFTFMPRETGPMEGKVIFTYENIDGDEIIHEVPFVFQVMEMPVWDDPYPWPEQQTQIPWAIIIFGIVLAVAVAGFIVWRKIRKRKLNKRLEIQDEEFNAALDLGKENGK